MARTTITISKAGMQDITLTSDEICSETMHYLIGDIRRILKEIEHAHELAREILGSKDTADGK